jgi:hypothetical protein
MKESKLFREFSGKRKKTQEKYSGKKETSGGWMQNSWGHPYL